MSEFYVNGIKYKLLYSNIRTDRHIYNVYVVMVGLKLVLKPIVLGDVNA